MAMICELLDRRQRSHSSQNRAAQPSRITRQGPRLAKTRDLPRGDPPCGAKKCRRQRAGEPAHGPSWTTIPKINSDARYHRSWRSEKKRADTRKNRRADANAFRVKAVAAALQKYPRATQMTRRRMNRL